VAIHPFLAIYPMSENCSKKNIIQGWVEMPRLPRTDAAVAVLLAAKGKVPRRF
jgi:hypothetical protein